MSEQRPKASALRHGVDDAPVAERAQAEERSKTQTTFTRGTPRPDVESLFELEMEEDDPDSAGTSATANASIALGAPTPPPASTPLGSSPRPIEEADIWDDETHAAQRGDLLGTRPPMPSTFDFEPEGEEPLPAGLSRGTLPPALLGIGIKAPPPMAVPTLRPPTAAPPPIRLSTPPPPPPPPVPASPNAPRRRPSPTPPREPGRVPETRSPAAFDTLAAGLGPLPLGSDRPPPIAVVPPAAQTLPGLAPPPEQGLAPLPAERPPGPALHADPLLLPTGTGQRSKSGSQRPWLVASVAVALLAIVIVLLVSRDPPPGALIVTVSAAQGEQAEPGEQAAVGGAVPKLEVRVDGVLRCTYSPCRVEGLSEGSHEVSALAPGYVNSERQTLQLLPGTDTIHNLALVPERKLSTLEISALGTDLTIWVDGQERGAPPVTVTDLAPGAHEVRVVGDRFEALDEAVLLEPGETKSLGPLRPKVKLGSLRIEPGPDSDGADVRLDGKRLGKLPVTLDLDNAKPHQLTATKDGFDRFEQSISFEDGKAEMVVHVALVDAYTETAEDEAEEPEAQSAKRRTSNGAAATLTMNSIPPAKILLDGKPIGQTPRIGVSTKPGVHSVTFVHPERGRKTVKVTLAPGQNRTVSVRF